MELIKPQYPYLCSIWVDFSHHEPVQMIHSSLSVHPVVAMEGNEDSMVQHYTILCGNGPELVSTEEISLAPKTAVLTDSYGSSAGMYYWSPEGKILTADGWVDQESFLKNWGRDDRFIDNRSE